MTIKYEPPETYRGIEIQNFQTRDRIEGRVKPQIDLVMGLGNIAELFRYCSDVSKPPEARLLAAAMLEAIFGQAANDRRVRPEIDLELVKACSAGLEQESSWRSPTSYGCLCDQQIGDGPEPEMRPVELTKEQLESTYPVRSSR